MRRGVVTDSGWESHGGKGESDGVRVRAIPRNNDKKRTKNYAEGTKRAHDHPPTRTHGSTLRFFVAENCVDLYHEKSTTVTTESGYDRVTIRLNYGQSVGRGLSDVPAELGSLLLS